MAAELPLGEIYIADVEFVDVPIGNEEPVGEYFQLPNVKEIVLERFGVAQEYLRRKGFPPLSVVTVNYRKRPQWFWAQSEDGSVGFVFNPTRANPDAFQIVRAGEAVHLPRNGVIVNDNIQDAAVIAADARDRDRRVDAQLALDIGRLDMGGYEIPAERPAARPAVASVVPAVRPVRKIEEMNLEQLRQFAKDNHIQLHKELKRDEYLNILKKTLDKLDKRRKHPFRITKDEKCLARNIKFFILVRNYYNLIINATVDSLKKKENREILLGFLEEIGLVVLEGTSRNKDERVEEYEKEISRDIDIQRAAKDDINSILEGQRLKVANRGLDIVMDKKIIPASPITFQQLHDALEPSGTYVSIYTRWEVAADKNRALAYLYQMIIDHDMKSKKVSRQEAINSLNRRLGNEIISSIRNHMHEFLYESVHPHLSVRYGNNNSSDMIRSLIHTARDLMEIGPNTTLKNKEGTILLDPRNHHAIIWTQYMNLIFEFISILPKPLRIEWAEAYLTSFIEGYDLRIGSFPRCTNIIPVFGKPLTPDTQQYPSCILGMTYHMLLSLYQVLFEIHAPKIKVRGKLVLQVEPKPVIVPLSVRLEEVTRKLARFQNYFIERNHIDEKDDFTEEQKEEFREEFLGYVISTNDVNDDYDWSEIVYEVVDGALEYLGRKRRSSKQSRQSKHKRRNSSKKRKSSVKKSSVKKSSSRGCVKQYTKKYMSRKSPAYPANQCRGRTMYGEDGIYKSTENSNGVYTWKKQN